MKKLIALILLLACSLTTTFAAPFSTVATITREKDHVRYLVDVEVFRLVEQNGQLTEMKVARPRIESVPGVPASLRQGPKPSDPNYLKDENVVMDVSWPESGKGGFAVCSVIIKMGDEVVSKFKLKLEVK